MKNVLILGGVSVLLGLMACDRVVIPEPLSNDPWTTYQAWWDLMDRHYALFPLKKIDWDSVYRASRQRINEATTPAELFNLIEGQIQAFQDPHLNLYTPTQQAGYNYLSGYPSNLPVNIRRYVSGYTSVSQALAYGRIAGTNLAYVRISSFGSPAEAYRAIDSILENSSDTSGLIIDVRGNGGGNSNNSTYIAGRFTRQERLFAHVRYRNGTQRTEFTPWVAVPLSPDGTFYPKPVCILTNRGCASATEFFLLAMRQLAQVRLVGGLTAGAFGNPIGQELPNGWTLRIPIWQLVDANYLSYEGTGLRPDVLVDNSPADEQAGTDRMLERAIALLKP